MKWFNRQTLSGKLVILFLSSILAISVVIHFTVGAGFRRYFHNNIQPHLFQYFTYLKQSIGEPPNYTQAKAISERLNLIILIHNKKTIWSSDGKHHYLSAIHYFQPNKPQHSTYLSGIYQRHLVVSIKHQDYTFTFITQRNVLVSPPWLFFLSLPLGILAIIIILYLMINNLFKPLKVMNKGIKRIGLGEFNHRINIQRQDELGELSLSINTMASDIENMLEAKRQLLLAISHELRSPITRSKIALSLLDDSKLKASIESDIKEMETMITELLEAEKMNHQHQVLHLEQHSLHQLINEIISTHYAQEAIQLNYTNNNDRLVIDEARIQFVLKNILGNALQYRKHPKDPIQLTTSINNQWFIIKVIDNGIGILADNIIHLTEPFYRVDSSRQRLTGGYGLGLYLCKQIVEAHQGQLIIQSQINIGTEVIIRLKIH